MVRVTQKALKPAKYHRVGEYDRDRLAKSVSETNRALSEGLRIPLLDFHTKPDDPRGLPRQSDDPPGASEISKGWLVGARQTDDGWVEYDFDVTDSSVAEQMQAGTIRFTSPQLSREYTDGLGRRFEELATHVALTPRPRNPDQGPFVFDGNSAQFSIEDAMDEDELKDEETTEAVDEPTDVEPEVNPDIPPPVEADPKSEAIIAGLANFGVILPADLKLPAECADVMIAAINSAVAAKAKADADKAADELPDDKVTEVSQPVQFSADELAALPPALRAKAERASQMAAQFAMGEVQRKKDSALAELKSLKLPKGLQDKLAPLLADQFSDSGEPGTLTVLEAAKLIKESLPPAVQFDAAEAVVVEPQREDGAEITDDEAEREAEAQLARAGFGVRAKPFSYVSPDAIRRKAPATA